jgi:hypothetical protein
VCDIQIWYLYEINTLLNYFKVKRGVTTKSRHLAIKKCGCKPPHIPYMTLEGSEVSGQLHTLASSCLGLGMESIYPLGRRLGTAELFWTFWKFWFTFLSCNKGWETQAQCTCKIKNHTWSFIIMYIPIPPHLYYSSSLRFTKFNFCEDISTTISLHVQLHWKWHLAMFVCLLFT